MVGLIPVVGYFAIRALQAREQAQVNTVYEEFTNALNQRDLASVLADCSEEKLALLWKHPDFALTMLKEDHESNFQHVPVALLYNAGFMKSILQERLLCQYVVNHCLSFGMDVGYLAACLSKTEVEAHTELAHDLLEGRFQPQAKTRSQVELDRLRDLEVVLKDRSDAPLKWNSGVATDPNDVEFEISMPQVVVKQFTDKEIQAQAKIEKANQKKSLKEYSKMVNEQNKEGGSLARLPSMLDQVSSVFDEVDESLNEGI